MNGEVPVITKKLIGHVDNSSYPLVTVNIDLTFTVPAGAKGPVPVMMEFGLSPEVLEMLKKRFPQMFTPGPGPTWQQQVLAMGWGYAEYIPTSVQSDNGEGLAAGIIGLVNNGQPRQLDDWGALRAWAWGASRALDYFETDKSVDAKHVGIQGHSRYGKAEPSASVQRCGPPGDGTPTTTGTSRGPCQGPYRQVRSSDAHTGPPHRRHRPQTRQRRRPRHWHPPRRADVSGPPVPTEHPGGPRS